MIDPRPSTNQSTSLKSGFVYLLMVSVRPSVQNTKIKELNHLHDSALIGVWAWIIVRLKSCKKFKIMARFRLVFSISGHFK